MITAHGQQENRKEAIMSNTLQKSITGYSSFDVTFNFVVVLKFFSVVVETSCNEPSRENFFTKVEHWKRS